jgi:phospholipid/cholesterol/gamma-HCH transport system substrate-binding protein
MKRSSIELGVGIFVLIGIVCIGYLTIHLGKMKLFEENIYTIYARFSSVSGLKEGAIIEIGGVQVGTVSKITLDQEDYEAKVYMAINGDIKLQKDTIASIRTSGIIGDKYVDISPGGDTEYIGPGEEVEETESAINLEKLISKYVFEKDKDK